MSASCFNGPTNRQVSSTFGDSLTFLGVYRMDMRLSNMHHVTWTRVAEEIDLNRLDYLEELRN